MTQDAIEMIRAMAGIVSVVSMGGLLGVGTSDPPDGRGLSVEPGTRQDDACRGCRGADRIQRRKRIAQTQHLCFSGRTVKRSAWILTHPGIWPVSYLTHKMRQHGLPGAPIPPPH